MRNSIALLSAGLFCATLACAALPEPPLQHTPWQPIPLMGSPDYVPGLVAMLFDAGMADPRGGDYREIEIGIPWEKSPSLTTHGWYFPEGFAVGWDGLVHKVVRAGGRVDLWQDVEQSRPVMIGSEATVSIPAVSGPVGVALLLRLGEAVLAQRMSAKRFDLPPPFQPDRRELSRPEWFTDAGTSWLSAVFHAAVEAHATGDDRLAIDISELLLRVRPRFEANLKDLNPEPQPQSPPPMAFLDPVPDLQADSERRLKNPRRPPFAQAALAALSPSARIAALIERLEDVDERQWMEPGGVILLESPLCKALIAEGSDAIEPLIDAMDHDQRLTRSFSFGRSFWPPRHLITVSETARVVLLHSYHIPVDRWKDPAERRAWFLRNKNRSQAERYFDLLSNDSNSDIQWLDAGQGLVGAAGAELRGHTNPSVSELLAKRVAQMKSNCAVDLALVLYQWEPGASLPSLQRVANWSSAGDLHGEITAARIQLGDPAASQEWAAALRGDQAVSLGELIPLWTSPGDETVQSVARRLFAGPDAPMSPTNLLMNKRPVDDLVHSPLLLQTSFRDAVFAALARKDVVGSVEAQPDGRLRVITPGLSMGCSSNGCYPGASRTRIAAKPEIRLGDLIALSLSGIEGFPAFELLAANDEKDRAIAQIGDFLRSHVSDLRAPAVTAPKFPGPIASLKQK